MPSLVNGRPNSNYDYDRGPNRMNGAMSDGFDNYNYRDDPYGRDDMRRDEEDRYRRSSARNGGPTFDRFNTDYLDQNSLSDFRSNEPKFELDHLATFAAGSRSGCIHAEDGLRKLRQMENTTGIWTMRCVLIVERNFLVILDNSTQEELERFPVQLVHDPTAIFKNDRREIYNNLILFTIVDDPKKRTSAADMHIFQSCKAPAQEIVDEIQAAQAGQQRVYPAGGGRIPPPPVFPAPEPNGAYDFQGTREFFNQNGPSQTSQFVGQQRSLITRVNSLREKEDMEGGSNEILERDVQLLNHCFDDIEKFVARLQQAAESYKELEKRKKERGAKNKKRQSGDGMLNARARPPPHTDFVDIFRKFKLSFNLLAKLKAHIHDPNAPELVHFLFTPLSLIFEASRDPYHGNQNLCDHAVAPVLTVEAKQLLLNCLSSKEIELWQQLGKHWTTSRSEWNGDIPAYVPEFYDGWQPAASVVDELSQRTAAIYGPPLLPPMPDTGRSSVYNHSPRPMPFPDEDPLDRSYQRGFEPNHRGYDPPPRSYEPSPRGFEQPMSSRTYEPLPSRGFEAPGSKAFDNNSPRSGMYSPLSDRGDQSTPLANRIQKAEPQRIIDPTPLSTPRTREEENNLYFDELKRDGNATIYEAAHDRLGKNPKELTVQKGDVLHVLDNSKNWWKLRNYKREVGFAPYTILKALKTEDENVPNGFHPYPENSQDNRGNYSRRDLNQEMKHARFYQDDDLDDLDFAFLDEFESSEPSYSRRSRSDMPPDRSSYPTRRDISPAPRGRSSPAPIVQQRDSSPAWLRQRDVSPGRLQQREDSPVWPRQREASPPRTRPRPPSPPAMPPPEMRRKEPRNYDSDRTPDNGRREKDHLQEELHTKIAFRQQKPSSRHLAADAPLKLSIHSTARDVADWLQMKGFSNATQETFSGFTGSDMFTLQLSQLSRYLGHDESIRLDGLLRLQKNTSGYATRSSKELNDILQRRMEHVNNADSKEVRNQERYHDSHQDRYQERNQDRYQDNSQDRCQERNQERYQERNQDRYHEKSQDRYRERNQDRSKSSADLGLNLKEQLVRQRSQLRASQSDLDIFA